MKITLLLIILTFFRCVNNTSDLNESIDIYKEEVPNVTDDLEYCTACITPLDAYNYEIARGSQPIHHKIDFLQAAKFFSSSSGVFSHSSHERRVGRESIWHTCLVFIQVDKNKGYKIAHVYSVNSFTITGYVARYYFYSDIIDPLINDFSSPKKDFSIVKAIYKKNKIKLDKKYGFSQEYSENYEEYNNPVLKEIRRNYNWHYTPDEILSDKYERFEMQISYRFACSNYYGNLVKRKECFSKIKYTDLVLEFYNSNFMSNYKMDSIFYNMPLTEKKERLTKKSFLEYIKELKWLEEIINERLENGESLDNILTLHPKLKFKPQYKNILEMRDTLVFNKLINEPFSLPEDYIEPNIQDENLLKKTKINSVLD